MSKSKKYMTFIVFSIILIAIFSIKEIINYNKANTKDLIVSINKYVETGDGLIYDSKLFRAQPVNIIPKTLGKQCGITDLKKQVFQVSGQDESKWLCLFDEGIGIIYKEQNAPYLDINEFQPCEIKIRDTNSNKEIILNDSNIIKETTVDMCEKNIVDEPKSAAMVKKLEFQSEKYPGLIYSYLLVHDVSENCFIIDTVNKKAWKIGHELEKYMM
ncbi:hypothetical protein [Clostridium sp. C8-1-8]|uniref:hypothetical protein n=1 Tax=Clostridium sp. C8-1-8 TaxID=2698831 RepID=UPI00136A0CEB|nr:hypothetical protein [Clostridium sp. C8-1-8]